MKKYDYLNPEIIEKIKEKKIILKSQMNYCQMELMLN